ncbi:MAG: L-2-hydroxyglutarate oxidase [Methanobacteriota archaeon]|jgi:L-2-hydroxyglutarate oxidase LhgO|nr:MAG: L-2-hydroxyglutarate oxidase [Euryarchaeota archaeon]
MKDYYDNIIIGGGIVGLSIAREIIKTDHNSSVLLVEKENMLGMHASGRNSGVLHSGIYYPDGSTKAKHCQNGSTEMYDFCINNNVENKKIGKIILPINEKDDEYFNILHTRAKNRVNNAELLDKKQLNEMEPNINSQMGKAIYLPNTVVVNPISVISKLYNYLLGKKVEFEFGGTISNADPEKSTITLKQKKIKYGKIYNCSGQHTDQVYKQFGLEEKYAMIPIRGSYYRLNSKSNIRLNHLIYSVPDRNIPFLGIHTLNTVNGETYFGPSAMPVLGREQYRYLDSVDPREAINIVRNLSELYIKDINNFRKYANSEIKNFGKKGFVNSIRNIVPSLKEHDIDYSNKVGIRAQLLNKKTLEFEMDFLVERQDNVVHVLNAVSPAFTCSFSMAKTIVCH